MIDTDKYEGYIEGNWRITRYPSDDYPRSIRTGDTFIVTEVGNHNINQPTMQLIADAPLLLQEVKRLRKENYKLKRFVENIEWGLKEVRE
tara:strand:- start:11158 stop:11427 length:270 start_codon:yes stop_codon:yes gene_type:complete